MSHRLNTVFGWGLAAALVVFGSSSLMEELYSTKSEHEEEQTEMASANHIVSSTESMSGSSGETMQVAAATTTGTEASGAAAMMGGGDPVKGKKVFKKCKACHTVDKGGKKKVGPNLYGIIGKDIATTEGFKYSKAMKALGGQWSADRLDEFLTKPKKYVKGTKMSFSGLKKEKKRSNLIAYLNENSDTPVKLTSMAAPAVAAMSDTPEPAETPKAAMEEAPKAAAEAPMEMAMAGDPKKGKKVFKKCKSCHTIDEGGKKKVGPNLYGIIGKDVATSDGFKYSKAMKALGGKWTAERLDEFLTKPKKYVKGTKMSFGGLKKEKKRANLIAYLKANGG